jgi:DNA-binding transcriptional LysR family regulator
MNLRALENLSRIHQLGSFTRVAELAHVTLSALSMQMKALEAELGAELFDRSHRPPRLTPLGRLIAEQARQVAEAQAGLRDLCTAGEGLTGHFRMGFTGSSSLQILPGLLALAERDWPGARFEFSSGLSEDLCARVRADTLDAAVVTEVPGAMGRVHSALLLEEPMVLIHAVGCEGEDGLPFLHFQPRSGIGVLISDFLDDLQIRPARSIQMDNIEAIIACVARGTGFSLLPLRSVQASGQAVRVRDLPPDHFRRRVVLITPQRERNAAQREILHSAILEVLRTDP